MKTSPFAALALLSLLVAAPVAQAGGRGGFFMSAGCGPRYYAPSVCAVPRVYCAPARVAYCAPVPVYYAPAPVIFTPVARPVVYRAPIVAAPVVVAPVSFVWRR